MKKRATADDRLKKRLDEVAADRDAKAGIIAAQQGEIEQLRDMVRELTTPKDRPFRTRKIPHGALDVTVRGAEATESEVWIEHVGEHLLILVGAAARRARGGGGVEQPRALGGGSETQPTAPPVFATAARPTFDLQDAHLRSVGIDINSFPQAAQINADSSIVNAAIGDQGDPRRIGGYQDRSEAPSVAAGYYGGWDGRGPRPAGWVDPDTPPPAETEH